MGFEHLKEKLDKVAEQEDANASKIEAAFNLPAGSTPKFVDSIPDVKVGELVDPTTGEVIVQQVEGMEVAELEKEDRISDLQIEAKTEEVYQGAIAAFESHMNLSATADPKFAARNGEVAAQFLNIALSSVNSKVEAKYKKAKIRFASVSAKNPSTTNNVIVADRNDVLRTLFGHNKDMEARDITTTIMDDVKK